MILARAPFGHARPSFSLPLCVCLFFLGALLFLSRFRARYANLTGLCVARVIYSADTCNLLLCNSDSEGLQMRAFLSLSTALWVLLSLQKRWQIFKQGVAGNEYLDNWFMTLDLTWKWTRSHNFQLYHFESFKKKFFF